MPYFDFNIEENISVDEFLSLCDDSEIKELIQALMIQSLKPNSDRLDSDFDTAVGKLIGNDWRLSKDDEETILKIANKIVA